MNAPPIRRNRYANAGPQPKADDALSSGARAVDVLATIRAHAESHRSRAASDAYSAQEAPRLESALAAVAELVEDARLLACALAGAYAAMDMEPPPATAPLLERYLGIKDAALSRMEPQS